MHSFKLELAEEFLKIKGGIKPNRNISFLSNISQNSYVIGLFPYAAGVNGLKSSLQYLTFD